MGLAIERTPDFSKLIESQCVFSKTGGGKIQSYSYGIFWCQNFKGDDRLPRNFQGTWSFKTDLGISILTLDIKQNLDGSVSVSFTDEDGKKFFFNRIIPLSSQQMRVFEYLNLETMSKAVFTIENGALKRLPLK